MREFHSTTVYDEDEVLEMLREACSKYGSQRKWAEAHGLPKHKVEGTLKRTQHPDDKIFRALGLVKETVNYAKKGSIHAAQDRNSQTFA